MEIKGKFKKGQSGNPAGRPKGAGHKLGEEFMRDLRQAWEERGVQALKEVDSATFVRVVAQVLPKEAKVDIEHSGSIEHRGLPEIGSRVAELLQRGADSDSAPLLPH